jgi:hypothetical protein
MIICRHKVSNKYFIVIENYGSSEMSFITPDGHVKNSLNIELFDEDLEIDYASALSNKNINEKQIIAYLEYKENRKEEQDEKLEIMVDEMSEFERNVLLRQLIERTEKKTDN